MKKIIIAAAALLMGAAVVYAQDLSMATETYNNGVTTLQEGNNAQALALFKEALSLGEACGEEGAELVTNCKNVIPGLILSVAKGHINAEEFDEAIASLEEAAAKAKEYNVEGVAEEALSLVNTANYRKGAALMKAKDMAGAAETLKKVVAVEPDNANAQLYLGQALLATGQTDAAIETLKTAAGLGKEAQANKILGNIFLKKGMALLKAGKNAECIEALNEANTYTENAAAYRLIASANSKLGKTASAIEAYKKYLELDPGAKDASGVKPTMAASAQKAGHKATAKEYYKMLVDDPQYGATAKQQLEVLK
jgi:tetratricopeptide (TPR) repeat protein